MSTPEFPSTLPVVSDMKWGPNSQLFETDADIGNREARRFTEVPSATASVTWRFLEEDFATFQEFYKNDLLRGHRWFSLPLPSGAGIVEHCVRFIGHRSSKRDGYGFRTVTADLDVRERRFKVVEMDLCFVSWTYPLLVEEEMDHSGSFTSGVIRESILDEMESTSLLLGGELRPFLQTYEVPVEALDLTNSLSSGVLTLVLKSYGDWPVEELDHTHSLSSGVLTVVLLSYDNYEVESLDSTSSLVSGVLS